MWRCVNHVILLVQKSYCQCRCRISLKTFVRFPKKSHPPAWSAKAVSNLPKPIAFFLGLRTHQIEESWNLHPANNTKTKTSSYSSSYSSSSSNNITKHYPSYYQPLKQRKKNMSHVRHGFCNNVIVALLFLSPPPRNPKSWKMGRSKMTILYYSCRIHSRSWFMIVECVAYHL